MPTEAAVVSLLIDHGFDVDTRADEPEPWMLAYVYGAGTSTSAPVPRG